MATSNIPKKYNDQSILVPPDQSVKDSTPFFSDTADETFWHSKSGKIWVSFYVLLIVIAFEIGIFIYAIGIVKHTPTAELKEGSGGAIPTATQIQPAAELGTYTVTVLNGSGIAGAAADAKKFLEEESLTVLSIGNATSAASHETSIYTKQNVPEDLVTKLKNVLAKRYILDEEIRYSDDGDADVTIIIGSEEASDSQ